MKRKLIGMCVAVCMAGAAWGEIIQTVGYNPARFGEYKRLKVTSGMETGGALVSPTLDGNGRSVTLSACEGECEEAAYRVERIESVNNGTVTSTGMTAGSVNGARGTVNVGNNSEIKSAVKGGEVAVKQLSASGSGLSVSEDLTLGGNKIKKPGYTNCQWKWETITHEGGSAKVLALAGCSNTCNKPAEQQRCDASLDGNVGQWNSVTCQCDCPAGMIVDANGQCACAGNKEWDFSLRICTGCANSGDLRERCESLSHDEIVGKWNSDECRCDCPQANMVIDSYEQCACPAAYPYYDSYYKKCTCDKDGEKERFCFEGGVLSHRKDHDDEEWVIQMPGTWDPETCECDAEIRVIENRDQCGQYC